MTKRKHFSPEALDASSLPKHRKPIPHAFVLDALGFDATSEEAARPAILSVAADVPATSVSTAELADRLGVSEDWIGF